MQTKGTIKTPSSKEDISRMLCGDGYDRWFTCGYFATCSPPSPPLNEGAMCNNCEAYENLKHEDTYVECGACKEVISCDNCPSSTLAEHIHPPIITVSEAPLEMEKVDSPRELKNSSESLLTNSDDETTETESESESESSSTSTEEDEPMSD